MEMIMLKWVKKQQQQSYSRLWKAKNKTEINIRKNNNIKEFFYTYWNDIDHCMRSAHYTQNALAVRYNNLLFIINFI